MHPVALEGGLDLTSVTKAPANPARLVQGATEGLARMFDPQQGLFCYRLRKTEQGVLAEGVSRRYTMMCLMGLRRLEESGIKSPVPLVPVLEGLLKDTAWIDNIGDLGNLLWTCAIVEPGLLKGLASRFNFAQASSDPHYARRRHTMELAWFLIGLCHWSLACPREAAGLEEVALNCYRTLRQNKGGFAYFGHLARAGSVEGVLRGRMGSFADQVYPIYGMTRMWQAFGNDEAKRSAIACAQALCQAQGSLGQWWWHYDSVTGQVVDEYPVFSVHQHGMAPMTLMALGDAVGYDFKPWIVKGMNWIPANNELSFDMEDRSEAVIWRCIEPSSFQWRGKFDALLHRRHHPTAANSKKLHVLFECRSYELGWLLYALANRQAYFSDCSTSTTQQPQRENSFA